MIDCSGCEHYYSTQEEYCNKQCGAKFMEKCGYYKSGEDCGGAYWNNCTVVGECPRMEDSEEQ